MRKILLLTLVMIATSFIAAQTLDKQQAAADAATRWLGLVDSDNYAQSWETAASSFKAAVSKEEWMKKLEALRGPLGLVESRDQTSATYMTQVPDMPDGQYVVVREQTRFEHKRNATETVTLAYDKGKWRVADYTIK